MDRHLKSSTQDRWPELFKVLYGKFKQINTHLTFLSSHSRSTIPTFEVISKLNQDISQLDLSVIKNIFPRGDIFYDYVDENQVRLGLIEKVEFSWEKGYKQKEASSIDEVYEDIENQNKRKQSEGNQLLIFEFRDVKMNSIGTKISNKGWQKYSKQKQKQTNDFFLENKDMNMDLLTTSQIVNILNSRNRKFENYVGEFLKSNKPLKEFEDECRNSIPKPPEFEDPIDQLKKRRDTKDDHTEKPTVDKMIDTLKTSDNYRNQIVSTHILNEALPARTAELLLDADDGTQIIHPELEEALFQYKGIDISKDLYIHQVEALKHIMYDAYNGKHVIITTLTSLGKSLIYQIPIINDLLWDITNEANIKKRSTTAFFIFPTKALAQDQKRHLETFLEYIPSLTQKRKILIDLYDGDTPYETRKRVRRYSDIIFTNPDTIHASILPNFDKMYGEQRDWEDFLLKLKYVVVDELHVYKGTFGVNVSYVMSRMQRIKYHLLVNDTAGYGHNIQFISCSATILNPTNHFRTICGLSDLKEIVHVKDDGSPMGMKKLVVWQPSALMNKRGEEIQSQIKSSNEVIKPQPMVPREHIIPTLAKILVRLLSEHPNIKCIIFCPIRQVCEMLMKEVRQLIRDTEISNEDIMSYRGGYSAGDRRVIEWNMFEGKLKAIIATNALELGIDLSGLDVVMTVGFPMLKLNLHQQFGRAGRSGMSSLAIFVAGNTPVDEYYIKNSQELTEKNYEDPCVEGIRQNAMALENHLHCGAKEIGIKLQDVSWFCNDETLFQQTLTEKLQYDSVNETYISRVENPHLSFSIRVIEDEKFAVIDITNQRNFIIEEIEALRTSFTLYEGAIFLHQGLTYLVKEFNYESKYAKVVRVKVDWTTSQRDFTDVNPIEIELIKCLQNGKDVPIFFGRFEIIIIVFGYFKINRRGEILEAIEVKNPPIKLYSKGLWIDIPQWAIDLIKHKNLNSAGAIHAAQHAIMNVLPVYISGSVGSDLGDVELSTECKAPEKEFASRLSNRRRPARLVFYDLKGGHLGTGISLKTFEYIDQILRATYDLITTCDCEWGCPKCVCGSFCKELSQVILKPGSIIIIGVLLGIDQSSLQQVPDGPELNMPPIVTDTILGSGSSGIKMSKDVQVIEPMSQISQK